MHLKEILEIGQKPLRYFRRMRMFPKADEKVALIGDVALAVPNVAFGHLDFRFVHCGGGAAPRARVHRKTVEYSRPSSLSERSMAARESRTCWSASSRAPLAALTCAADEARTLEAGSFKPL